MTVAHAGLNLVGEQDLFWGLADIFAPTANYNPDKVWLEGYLKPGYIGRGLFRVSLGWRSVDVSAGARELKLGTGMLFANGGSSGFERGALKFGPRKAWELAGIAKFMKNGFSLTGFYLDPNEVPSNDAFTELAGGDFRFDGADGGFAGVTYANVLKSNSAYPQADPGNPPIITPGAREGLNVINVYGRTGKLSGALTNWYFSADLAYQWNDRIDMQAWGGRGQVAYTFAYAMWTPRLMYTFQSFSGDDPDTTGQERAG
jgi:hypothetical protein